MDELVKYLRALVFLQVQAQTGSAGFSKPELLLSRAGFKSREIGEILGKSEAAVQKTISRAKKASTEATSDEQD